ncbi:P-loop containing nucleoside triphosphate hydrolase protein [Lipomyces arxii]|uniref:P-loop containing nucleoside triphosphate hydrolase protein n=1 Tax=Lipomyces arxii TaxID=56418 RepID=UPI0034CF0295
MTAIVHLEALAKSGVTHRYSAIRNLVQVWVRENFTALRLDWHITPTESDDPTLAEKITRISVVEIQGADESNGIVLLANCKFEVHVYELRPSVSVNTISVDDAGTVASTVIDLPCRTLDGLWESLIFDDDIKHRLLHFMSTLMLFSSRKVNSNLVSCGRIILLHGPPGTGKTSLCRAMAQKLKIRLSRTFPDGKLVEISAHALFSKWFSESGKLVGKLFEQIRELVQDERCLVFVLIDEIESLTAARKAAVSGNEPSDALRVVNAFLTELDRLRDAKNVLILTTSNLIDAMDSAFIDRVDIKQYVGYPSTMAVYEILRSCMLELIRCRLVDTITHDSEHDLDFSADSPSSLSSSFTIESDDETDQDSGAQTRTRVRCARKDTDSSEKLTFSASDTDETLPIDLLILPYTQASLALYSAPGASSSRLLRIAQSCKSFGGRTLRRLVVLAHAKYIHREQCSLDELLDALQQIVSEEYELQLNAVRVQMQNTAVSL